MADDNTEHFGQDELERCEVTHTTTSSAVSLREVISRPSGKGNNGDEDINFLEKCFLCWLERTFEDFLYHYYGGFTKKLDEPEN